MAQSQSSLQAELAKSPTFQARIAQILVQSASAVLAENNVGATHAARAAYAKYVLQNPLGAASIAAIILAQTGNISPTIEDTDNGINATATDAAVFSQVNTSWNVLAGIDQGS